MDLTEYRNSENEKVRTADLMAIIPSEIQNALDIGARDGFFSKLLAEKMVQVTALDLETPSIDHNRIRCVKGNVTSLDFPDNYFDLVLCSEVLEHIPTKNLHIACNEIFRVANKFILIGVPYKQDIRVGRTSCQFCGKISPPWGHLNRFDETRLSKLFKFCDVANVSFVGSTDEKTNILSCLLMDLAGNPFGTYSQEEPCIHCGNVARILPHRTLIKKILTKISFIIISVQKYFLKPHPNWIHILFVKQNLQTSK